MRALLSASNKALSRALHTPLSEKEFIAREIFRIRLFHGSAPNPRMEFHRPGLLLCRRACQPDTLSFPPKPERDRRDQPS